MLDEIEVAIVKDDHKAVSAALEVPIVKQRLRRKRASCHFELADLDTEALDRLCESQVSYTQDVHTHARDLHVQLGRTFRPAPRQQVKQPLRQALSTGAWDLICQKRQWRGTLHATQKLRKEYS